MHRLAAAGLLAPADPPGTAYAHPAPRAPADPPAPAPAPLPPPPPSAPGGQPPAYVEALPQDTACADPHITLLRRLRDALEAL